MEDLLEVITREIAKENNLKIERIHVDELVLLVSPKKLDALKIPENCVIVGNTIRVKGRENNAIIRIAESVYRFKNFRIKRLLKVYI